MQQRGFTLVELLVALTVMALLAVLSWRGIDGMTRAHEITGARNEEVLAMQTALAQWGADLDAVVPLAQMPALEWNGRVLRMTRRGTASVTDGIHVVAWARRDGQWLRWETPALPTRADVESAWQQADLWSARWRAGSFSTTATTAGPTRSRATASPALPPPCPPAHRPSCPTAAACRTGCGWCWTCRRAAHSPAASRVTG
jgi:prepilin-type N-terminal cleavage/methylation domain-containing protein